MLSDLANMQQPLLDRLQADVVDGYDALVRILERLGILPDVHEFLTKAENIDFLTRFLCAFPNLLLVVLCPCFAVYCIGQIWRNKLRLLSLLKLPVIGGLAWYEWQRAELILSRRADSLTITTTAITAFSCLWCHKLCKGPRPHVAVWKLFTVIITAIHDGLLVAVTEYKDVDMRLSTFRILTIKMCLLIMQSWYMLSCIPWIAMKVKEHRDAVLEPLSVVGNYLFLGTDEELHPDDFDELPDNLKPDINEEKLDRILSRVNHSKPNPLLRSLRRAFMPTILYWVLQKIVQSSLKFLQIYLLYHFIEVTGDKPSQAQIVHTMLSALAVGLCRGMVDRSCRNREVNVVIISRGAIGRRINRKILQSPAFQDTAPPAISFFNLGLEALPTIADNTSFILSAVLDGGIAAYLLNSMIGSRITLPLLTTCPALIFTLYYAIKAGKIHRVWLQSATEHLRETFSTLYQLPILKMTNFGHRSVRTISGLYEIEKDSTTEANRIRSVRRNAALITYAVAPTFMLSSIASLSDAPAKLPIQTALSALCLTYLMTKAVIGVPVRATALKNAVVELGTIEALLFSTSHPDYLDFGRAYAPQLKPNETDKNDNSQSEESNQKQDDAAAEETVETIEVPSGKALNGSTANFTQQRRRKREDIIIQLDKLNVTSKDGQRRILKDIDLSIRRSKLYMFIGGVGSGKTTLINALINEISSTSLANNNKHKTHMGVCAQVPWLPNTSIRDCIVGPEQFDAVWYAEVIAACDLELDIAKLDMRDKTLTGINGCLLAHSQAQRIALARAIYGRPEMFILDDIFSGVDRETCHVIFERLFGEKGLMRIAGATVILATHCVEHHQHAYRVFKLKDGMLSKVRENLDLVQPTVAIRKALTEKYESLSLQTGWRSRARSNVRSWMLSTDDDESSKPPPEALDYRKRHLSSQKWLKENIQWHLFAANMAPAILLVILGRYLEISLRLAFGENGYLIRHWLAFYVISIGLFFGSCLANYMFGVPYLDLAFGQTLYRNTAESIIDAKFNFIMRDRIGFPLGLMHADAKLLTGTLSPAFVNMILQAMHMLVDMALICAGGWHATVIMMVVAAAFYGIQEPYLESARNLRNADNAAQAMLNTHLSETNSGVGHIRNLGWGVVNFNRGTKILETSQEVRHKRLSTAHDLSYFVNIVLTLAAVALIAVGSGSTSTTHRDRGLAMLNVFSLGKHFVNFLTRRNDFEAAIDAVGRMRKIIDLSGARENSRLRHAPESWPCKGLINLKIGNAHYWPSLQATGDPGISNIRLAQDPGAAVGIFGRSGSGKKTLALSILNFLTHDREHTMMLDGIDIGIISWPDIRKRVTVISQLQPGISGTIRDHLVPPELADHQRNFYMTDSNLQIALKKVSMWRRIVEAGGLDASYQNARLSHGQKQMFSWARALLHGQANDSQLLLSVSATNDMDYDTGEMMIQMMRNNFKECTKIIMTHRLEVLYDTELFELHNGTERIMLEPADYLKSDDEDEDEEGTPPVGTPVKDSIREKKSAKEKMKAKTEGKLTAELKELEEAKVSEKARAKQRSKMKLRMRGIEADITEAMPESALGTKIDPYAEASVDTNTDVNISSEADQTSAAETMPRATLASEVARERAAKSAATRFIGETESELSSAGNLKKLEEIKAADGGRRVRRVAPGGGESECEP